MEMKTETLEIGDVVYHFSQGEFFKTKDQAEKLLSLAQGMFKLELVDKDGTKQPNIDVDVGAILKNITNAECKEVQDFILSTVKVVKNGEGILFTNKEQRSLHFNGHRSDYYQVLVAGVKFHFLDFLPSGGAFMTSTIGQAINKAVTQM